nr:hypothetical protein [Chlamydiota bacterium]
QIKILESLFPTMKMLMKALLISAYDLKLPESLAQERTRNIALQYLDDYFHEQMIPTLLIPPHPKTQKALSKALLRAIQMLVPIKTAPALTRDLILALQVEKAFVSWIETLPSTKKSGASQENTYWKSLEKMNAEERLITKTAISAQLLVTIMGHPHPLNIPQAMNLLLDIAHDASQLKNPVKDIAKTLANTFLYSLREALAETPSNIPQIIKSVIFIGQVLKRTSLLTSLPAKEILESFVDSLDPEETMIDEKMASSLERHLKAVAPSPTQARNFAKLILDSDAPFEIFEEVSV